MILSNETKNDIRRLHDIWVARLAFEYRCERPDVLAAIPPSQPEPTSLRTAADTPAAPPSAGETTDGEARNSSPAPSSSVEPIPEAPKPLPAAIGHDQQPAEAKTSDQADGGAVSAVKGKARLENAEGVEPPPSAQPSKPSRRAQLRALIIEHPTWPAKELAHAMGIEPDNVRSIATQIGVKLPKAPTAKERKAKTTAALKVAAKPDKAHAPAAPPPAPPPPEQPPVALPEGRDDFDSRLIALNKAEPDMIRPRLAERLGVKKGQVNAAVARLGLKVPHARASDDVPFVPEIIPPANPQKPVGTAPKEMTTLTERVRCLHHQHPNWTATLIAKELGAKQTSVSTILSIVRGKPAPAPAEQPQFTGRRQMVEHYGAIAKRLGKPS